MGSRNGAIMTVAPFRVDIPEADLQDLRQRLDAARWVQDFANDDWRYGANVAYLKELVAYWRDQYDWRLTEARINRFANFRTEIDGIPIHFIHEPGRGPAPLPLMLNHGWPWTFWDYQKLIGPLSDPASHGGDAADAFEIVAPSLPGFGFSSPLTVPGVNFSTTADLWVALMAKLGHERFATQGADWGAIVSAQLGHKYADRLIGLHVQLLAPLGAFNGDRGPAPEDFAPDEQSWLAKNTAFFAGETGYMQIQSTKPQTPAVALNDSPIGLLAWIVEKRRSWSDSHGDVESRFTKDELIDTVMIYWLTQTFATSARYYYEAAHRPWQASHDRRPVVEAPTAVAVFPQEVVLQPRAWADRYYNIRRWTPMKAGGHFGPMEEPGALIEDLRNFFRAYRQ
jgi:pimeloyl-ACP methyl ester carboxylesterase